MTDTAKPPAELTSILSQVQILQSDRERLMRELEDANGKVDKLQVAPATVPLPAVSRCSDPNLCFCRRGRGKR